MSLFFWGLPEEKIASFGLVSPFSFVIAFFLATWLNTKFGKRETIVGAGGASVLCASTPVLLRMAGVLPPNGSPALAADSARVLPVLLRRRCGADDQCTLRARRRGRRVRASTGRRQEGVFYSSRILFSKLTIGLGHVVAGVAMD